MVFLYVSEYFDVGLQLLVQELFYPISNRLSLYHQTVGTFPSQLMRYRLYCSNTSIGVMSMSKYEILVTRKGTAIWKLF
jgi:hypothetical protein